jgi:hypothetical protein
VGGRVGINSRADAFLKGLSCPWGGHIMSSCRPRLNDLTRYESRCLGQLMIYILEARQGWMGALGFLDLGAEERIRTHRHSQSRTKSTKCFQCRMNIGPKRQSINSLYSHHVSLVP